jgi:hypothetical protein
MIGVGKRIASNVVDVWRSFIWTVWNLLWVGNLPKDMFGSAWNVVKGVQKKIVKRKNPLDDH